VAQHSGAAANALESAKALAAEVAVYSSSFASHGKNPDPSRVMTTTDLLGKSAARELAPALT
jgi:hypothetical protein